MKTKPAKKPKRRAAAVKRGRPAEYRTEAARATATRQRNHLYQTDPDYKERRRLRYLEDENYREACRQRAREYAEAQQSPAIDEYRAQIDKNLAGRKKAGTVRVFKGARGRDVEALTYSIPECAAIMGRPTYVVREWVNSGRFPSPAIQAKGERGPTVSVYTEAQVVALAKAAVKHLRIASAHLTVRRTDAIIAFRKAMRA